MKKYNKILSEVLEKITPKKENLEVISKKLNETLGKIKENIKSKKIKADIFIGGSFAKGTVIKKRKI
jgi:tRNA nucleotidyltransferase (CCA-adding enzyme)